MIDLPDVAEFVAAAVLSVGGAGAIMLALSKFFGQRLAERWLEGVKTENQKELARFQHVLDERHKRTQARIDHAVTVSRAQFEVEFQVVREIWKLVARSRAAVLGVVEHSVPENDTPEARLNRFFEARREVHEARRKLVLAIDNNSPFYPESIYQAVDTFRTRITLELSRLETTRPSFAGGRQAADRDWFDERREAGEDAVRLADAVSLAIRHRLGSIVIQDGPTVSVPDDLDAEGLEQR